MESHIIFPNTNHLEGAMWQPTIEPHGTISFAHNNETCQNTIHPCLPTPAKSAFQLTCHVTVWSYVLYGQLPREHCTDCTSSKKLHVWQNEQNTISCSYDVYFISFKLHWVLTMRPTHMSDLKRFRALLFFSTN
jgi:hypothetical protein